MSEIEQAMKAELILQHRKAQGKITAARQAIRQATDAALSCAALIDKLSSHRTTPYSWLAEHTEITGQQGRGYMRAFRVKSRDIAHDKVVLQLLGVLDKREPTNTSRGTRVPPSAAQQVSRASAQVSKTLKKRGVDDMTSIERLQLRESVKPLAELFLNLSSLEKP